jgi:two-component system sensor histidine kinase UhpB
VEKHASDASRVLVRLLPSSREICLLVEDDGRGFNPQPDGQGHYGLAGMGERVQGVGGRLTIDSSPGKGTRLEVYIPT